MRIADYRRKMQKLRPPTWRRSRTPTPIEMRRGAEASVSLDLATPPTPSGPSFSIDVEPHETEKATSGSASGSPSQPSFLRLPHSGLSRRRTRSFDFSQGPASGSLIGDNSGTAAGSSGPLFGMLRRSFSRHSSTSERGGSGGGIGGSCGSVAGSVVCVHCLCAEEYERILNSTNEFRRYSQEDCLFRRSQSESEFDSRQSSSCESVDPVEDESDCSRLSFLGESFECHQKVEPWIRKNKLSPDTLPARMQIRRGRSLGLAGTSVTISEPNLRRGGSECQSGIPTDGADEEDDADLKRTTWHQTECGISFNISFSSTSELSTNYQVSTNSATSTGNQVPGKRSPAGTPRLERQSALSGWMETEPSLDLLTPFSAATAPPSSRQVSMETHASISLEVDSGASVMQQTASFESQCSVSLDVHYPDSSAAFTCSPVGSSLAGRATGTPSGGGGGGGGTGGGRPNSLESQTSVDSMASSIGLHSVGSSCGSISFAQRSLLARRKCLSAGASPNTSPPISRYNSSTACPPSPRLNLYTAGSSSEYGEGNDPEVIPLSPSPPAEIYLAVPVLSTTKPSTSSGSTFRLKRHQSTSYERDGLTTFPTISAAAAAAAPIPVRSPQAFSLRPEMPLRSRSIEIALPTAHHRTEYHDLAGSARRQQWVSRLKYANHPSIHFSLFFYPSTFSSLALELHYNSNACQFYLFICFISFCFVPAQGISGTLTGSLGSIWIAWVYLRCTSE